MSTQLQEPPTASTASRIAAQLNTRLDGHTTSGDAFVVSVYGEWGIGKTHCLRNILAIFEARLKTTIESLANGEPKAIVVPVFFDPWQYEHEEHLVVPLLKTIQLSLQRVADSMDARHPDDRGDKDLTARAITSVRTAAGVFGDVAVSLMSGFKFKFAPLSQIVGFDVEFAPKDAIDAARKAAERREASKRPPEPVPWYRRLARTAATPEANASLSAAHDRLSRRESLYFDTRSVLSALTEKSTPALRLVVLIDDLDRCLPEKAIQVLESVKLFLNVPGFSFVLAVDDEVVERGIAHRYRAYGSGDGTPSMNAPISGAEYLEKVVHLPVHLQRWTKEDAAAFLRATYPTLFAPSVRVERASDSTAQDPKLAGAVSGKGTAVAAVRADDLLNLVLDSIPLVPRKLIRLSEALEFQRLHFAELKTMELWQPLHAARVVALQQLYPGLYRHLRLRASRYWRLFRLRRDDFGESIIETGESFRELQQKFADRHKLPRAETPSSTTDTMRENLTLLGLVEEAGHQRGSPDPLGLFPAGTPDADRSPEGIRQGLTLDDFAQLYLHGLQLAPMVPSPRKAQEAVPDRVAEVNDPRALLEWLLQGDTLGRREYLQSLANAGRPLNGRLPDEFFGSLLQGLENQRDRVTEIEWLRDIAELTSPEQLLTLYQKCQVLEAWLVPTKGIEEHAT